MRLLEVVVEVGGRRVVEVLRIPLSAIYENGTARHGQEARHERLAQKLLTEAGYPQGIDLVLNSPDGRYLKDKEVAEAVAGQLTRAGIRTRVKTHEWTAYLSQLVYPHKANPMYLIGWGNTTWDADGTLTPLFRSGSAQANYHSPDFDGLVDEAQTAVDPKRRLELYAKAQRLMLDDDAVLPLYQQMDIYGVNKRANFQAPSSEQLVGVWMSLKDGK